MRRIFSLTLFALLALCTTLCRAADIAVSSVVLKYTDNITNANNIVVRELQAIHDNAFWSNPKSVDIEVQLENLGSDPVKFITLKAELYYLLEHRANEIELPPMPNELKTLSTDPVWVWTTGLGEELVKQLAPGETRSITFKNKMVNGDNYATDYAFNAFAVRVFAIPSGGDGNYADNVTQKIISYTE